VYFNYFLAGKHNGGSTNVSPLAGKLFVVIGAGGAGKALAYGAKEKGARVVIANRTYGKLRDLFFSCLNLKHVELLKFLRRCSQSTTCRRLLIM